RCRRASSSTAGRRSWASWRATCAGTRPPSPRGSTSLSEKGRKKPMISRRDFMASAAATAAAAFAAPGLLRAAPAFDPQPGPWRSCTVTTRLDLAAGTGGAQAWVPLPSIAQDDWVQPEDDAWTGNAATAEVVTDPRYGARMLRATFAGDEPPLIEVTSRFR